MIDREHLKFSRNIRIINFFSKNLSVFAAQASALNGYVDDLNNHFNSLTSFAMTASTNITGYTIQKSQLRTLMETQTMKVSGSMRAYFVSIDDNLNAELATVSKSFLRNSRQEISLVKCQNMLTMAQEHSAVIVPFGASGAMLSDLEIHINNYKNALIETKFARKEKVNGRKKYSETLLECDKILNIISSIMKTVGDVDPFLYKQFLLLMRIGKTGGGKGKKPDFEDEISGGEVAVIADLNYQKERSFKIKNLSKGQLKWGLSQSETDFTNPFHLLEPLATSQKLSSTLAPNGNFVLLENLSASNAKIKLWIDEKDLKNE